MAELTMVSDAEPHPKPTSQAVSAWLVGFHGAVQASEIAVDGSISLRSLALSHRSLGTQRLSILTDLPSLRDPRGVPRGQDGFRPVGAWEAAAPSADLQAATEGVQTAVEAAAPSADLQAATEGVQAATDRVQTADDAGDATTGLPGAPRRRAEDLQARDVPVPVWDESEPLSTYLDRRLLQARVLYLPNRGRAYHAAKRVIDVVGAVVLLVLTSPLLLALTVVIKLDSPGPAIFRHQRVTLGGRLFTFYKFRTMWVDARERFPELYDYQRTGRLGEIYYKLEDDPRNTGVGRWLRRTTLDELPNLFNVLKGDMTLVGPRPELPQLVAHYHPEDLALFFTKAGVTGLAQIAGRSLLTVRERIALDLRYVAQQTLLLDLRIIARTVAVVLLGRGAF